MNIVKPKIYLLAETKLHTADVAGDGVPDAFGWLDDLKGFKIMETITGSDPEMLIELAARRCYKSFAPGLNPNVTKIRTDSEAYHSNILDQRHGSVMMHATCTWAFEYVSRVYTHEQVRNATGNAFSQESMRFVRPTDISMWLPPCIADDPWAVNEYYEAVAEDEMRQARLAEHFKIDTLDFAHKKILTSAFRRLIPDGIATGIVATFNFRSLRWFIEQRSQPAAEEEIRLVIDELAGYATKRWPLVFGDLKRSDDGTWVPAYSKV